MENVEVGLIIEDLKERMTGATETLHKSLNGLRTGRASSSMLDPIEVDVYGSKMPIKHLAGVNTPEPRLITVQVYDDANVKAVEKAIMESSLGLNPMTEGKIIRINIPDLSEERRKQLAKTANEYLEHARIAIRNVRRDGNDKLKKMEKANELSEDELANYTKKVQEVTDTFIAQAEENAGKKCKEILES